MTVDEIISQALTEDIGEGDHTSDACIPSDTLGRARLLVKESGILAGVEIALRVFQKVDPQLTVEVLITDGSRINYGDIVLTVSGRSNSILKAERLVLNFMQRMSGIATKTDQLVRLMGKTDTRLLDTRKTTPLLREIEKMAVRTGGGHNHRFGLYDMVMIKDNHVDMSGGIAKAIDRVHDHLNRIGKKLAVEIEVRNKEELTQAIDHGGIDRIMLDNFTPEQLKDAVRIVAGRFETEASGGITESNIAAYAATGVDFISVGALTHHVRSLDLSLKAY
jgi:nicotinate-nucleotide pyrophosphorylase (carboxylating)